MAVQPVAESRPEVPIPPLVKKNTFFLATVQAITGAGLQLVPALGAIQVVALMGGNATFAGITTSIMGLARVLTAYPLGRLSDERGRKFGLYAGLWLSLVGSLVIGVATLMASLLLFCLGALIFGAGVGAVQQMRVAAADMYPPARRSEGMSLILMGSLFGAGISPLVVTLGERAGLALGVNPIAVAWLLVPLLVLPCFLLVLAIRPDPRRMAQNLEAYYPAWALEAPKAAQTASEIAGQARVALSAIVAAVAVQGQMVMMMTMTALALKAQDCTLPQISLSVAIHVAGMFALSWPIGRLADRIGRRAVILAGLAVAGLGALMVGLGDGYLLITAGTFLVGLGWSGAYLGSNTMLADVTPAARRGQAVGVLELWANLAGMILPLAGGLIVQRFDLHVLGFVGAVLVVFPFLMMSRVREEKPGSYK